MHRQDSVAVRLIVVVLVALAGASGPAVAGASVAVDGTPQTAGEPTRLASDGSGGGQAAVATGPQAQTSNNIDITHEYRLTPNEPGQIDVQWTFDVPDSVTRLNTSLPAGAMDARPNGFDREGGRLVWRESEQSTRTPAVTFALAVNETTDDGSPKYVDTGDWALVKRPPLADVSYIYYTNQGQPSVTRTNVTAGEGVAANAMVYLGEYEMTTRSAHGQQFRLVVPAAATLTEKRADIFDSVAAASDTLRVGDRDGTVTMFAAPTTVSWGVAGLQRGDSAFYAVANRSVDDPNNTWVHEYVHTRQDFETTDATKWFIEASAEYYGAQLTLRQGRIDFGAFSDSLGVGAQRRYDDVVLTAPDTWHGSADYDKGGLVAGDIDRRIRVASDNGASMQAVVQRLNRDESAISQQRFLTAVGNAGGSGVADTARRFTERTDGPAVWSQREHSEAFADLPAQFSYTFPEGGNGGFRVRGPFRNGTEPGDMLVTNETLVADIAVENVGGSAGTYDLTVTRDGVPVANRTGTAAAGEQLTETVSFPFSDPGTYRLGTGTDTLGVRVTEPATPTVTELSVNRTTVRGGGPVRVTAVVRNDDARPATGVMSVEQDGSTILDRRVSLDSGSETELTATVSLSALGTTTFTAGGESVAVTVEEASPPGQSGSDEAGETTGAIGPGFGVVGALLALAALLLVARRVE